jgi:hypothetical protein
LRPGLRPTKGEFWQPGPEREKNQARQRDQDQGAIADRHGLPIACRIASALPAEVALVEETLDSGFLEHGPERRIRDKAYDIEGPDPRLAGECGSGRVAPNRSSRKLVTQDGRPRTRCCRRWKIERLFWDAG